MKRKLEIQPDKLQESLQKRSRYLSQIPPECPTRWSDVTLDSLKRAYTYGHISFRSWAVGWVLWDCFGSDSARFLTSSYVSVLESFPNSNHVQALKERVESLEEHPFYAVGLLCEQFPPSDRRVIWSRAIFDGPLPSLLDTYTHRYRPILYDSDGNEELAKLYIPGDRVPLSPHWINLILTFRTQLFWCLSLTSPLTRDVLKYLCDTFITFDFLESFPLYRRRLYLGIFVDVN